MASNIFAGSSRYAQDFSSVIERSVGIASLSLTQMQQQRVRSSDALTATRTLESKVVALQATIQTIEDSVTKGSWQTTSSDSAALRPSSSDGVAAASYTLRVVSLGSMSTAVGKTSGIPVVSDPSAGSFLNAGVNKLTLRITDHNTAAPASTDTVIDVPLGASLQSVVNAINAQAGAKVQAAIVNVGTTDAPNYTISLQSTRLGKLALQLKEGNPPPADNSGDLLNVDETDASDPSLGARAEYRLNGAALQSDTRTVIIAPKLSVDLLKADSTKDISVAVTRSTSAFTGAINTFINAYNALAAELDKASGKDSAIRGDSLLSGIRQQLSSAMNAGLPGHFSTMAKIGIEYTASGTLKFNSALFEAETKDKFASLAEMVGTSKTTGFTKALADALQTMESDSTGFLKNAISTMEASLVAEDARIASETSRVEQFTRDLQARLAKADALIAQLEQQATYFNNMFEAMRVNQESMS